MTNRIETLPIEIQDKIYEYVFKELYRDLIKEYNVRCYFLGEWLCFDMLRINDPFLVKLRGRPASLYNYYFSDRYYSTRFIK